ncbi:MAG: TonB-dependent receptor domain-containing protein, partial [Parvibaculales bacterium]
RVAIFNNDFEDFIFQVRDTSLDEVDDDGDVVTPGYRYDKGDAELSGYEIEYLTDISVGGRMLDVKLSYSAMTGELSDGGNLPAMPSDKINLGLGMDFNALRLSMDIENAADQDDIAADELPTDGHTAFNIAATWQPSAYDGLTLTAAVRNLTDEEIRHHNSPLKDRLPEAGQDIRLTARYKF